MSLINVAYVTWAFELPSSRFASRPQLNKNRFFEPESCPPPLPWLRHNLSQSGRFLESLSTPGSLFVANPQKEDAGI